MQQNDKSKVTKGCLIASAIGCLVFAVVAGGMLLILVPIAAPAFLKAQGRAQEGMVKANISYAATVASTYLAITKLPADKAIEKAIKELNCAGTPDDKSDDPLSPFDHSLPAFGSNPAPGVVVLEAKDPKTIIITGYNKDSKPIDTKTVAVGDY